MCTSCQHLNLGGLGLRSRGSRVDSCYFRSASRGCSPHGNKILNASAVDPICSHKSGCAALAEGGKEHHPGGCQHLKMGDKIWAQMICWVATEGHGRKVGAEGGRVSSETFSLSSGAGSTLFSTVTGLSLSLWRKQEMYCPRDRYFICWEWEFKGVLEIWEESKVCRCCVGRMRVVGSWDVVRSPQWGFQVTLIGHALHMCGAYRQMHRGLTMEFNQNCSFKQENYMIEKILPWETGVTMWLAVAKGRAGSSFLPSECHVGKDLVWAEVASDVDLQQGESHPKDFDWRKILWEQKLPSCFQLWWVWWCCCHSAVWCVLSEK